MRPFVLHRDEEEPVYAALETRLEESIRRPPCECFDCQDGFYTAREQREEPRLSYRDRLSNVEAERRARSMVEKIHIFGEALKSRLEVLADVLMSRWTKLSQEKRRALLKGAAPELEENQWLIPRYSYQRERLYIHQRNLRRRHQLLLPWLNVEVLTTNPLVLFALLHYRTIYDPPRWAAFDSRQLTLCWAAGFFDVDFSKKCVVMYGENYGSLVDWEEKAAHRAEILGFPRAILVLEAQAYLLEVLDNIVSRILAGVDSSQLPRTEKWKALVNNKVFKEPGAVELWSPYTHPAFSPPPKFDSKYLVSLAKSRQDATADHLLYLQCDAAYMRRHLKIMFATEIFKKATEADKGLMVARRIRLEVRNHHWWQWIEAECRHVDMMREMYHGDADPSSALPLQYELALGALELLIVNQVIYRAQRLEELLPYVPGLKEHWDIDTESKPANAIGMLRRNTQANTQETLINDPLDWCLVQLLGKPDAQRTFDHAMLFAMLEEHMAKKPSERARLDEVIYQVLSDIAACHEMLLIVRSHRPLFKFRKLDDVRRTENRSPWRPLLFGKFSNESGVCREIGTSFIKDFYRATPPTGPKTQAWLNHYRVLRTHLLKFWESIRETIKRDFKLSGFNPTEIDSHLKVVSANLSEQYIMGERHEEDTIIAAIREREKPQNVPKFIESDSPVVPTVPRQEKAKTRGRPPDMVDSSAPEGDDSHQQEEFPGLFKATPIELTKQDSLDVIQLMFPEKDDAAKSVLWDRFVHAMADAGFIATNNSGSPVSFKHRDGDGRIVFHRPHPDSKIDPIMLRNMGKRMAKWFGWRRDLFSMCDKDV